MADFRVHEKIESLYSEGAPGPVKSPVHGFTRRMISAGSIPLVLLTGLGLGPAKARAQDGYVAGAKWCQPNLLPSQPFYYKIFATEVDINGNPLGYRWVAKVPSSVQMININGPRSGGLYELRAQTCIKNTDDTETCSVDSANKPLVVARLYGNSDVSSVNGTINRVDFYDVAVCVNVIRGLSTRPEDVARCDFNGDGVVNAGDLIPFSLPAGNFGKIQANPLGTSYMDCSNGRCPETGTCGEIPYGRAASMTFVATTNPEHLLRKGPEGGYTLAETRTGHKSVMPRHTEFKVGWSTGDGSQKDNDYGGRSALSKLFIFNNPQPRPSHNHSNHYR